MSSDDFEEMRDVCAMCNHNRIYHTYVREMEIMVCKVKACKCLRNVRNMMRYSQDLLELWR